MRALESSESPLSMHTGKDKGKGPYPLDILVRQAIKDNIGLVSRTTTETKRTEGKYRLSEEIGLYLTITQEDMDTHKEKGDLREYKTRVKIGVLSLINGSLLSYFESSADNPKLTPAERVGLNRNSVKVRQMAIGNPVSSVYEARVAGAETDKDLFDRVTLKVEGLVTPAGNLYRK